MREASRRLSQSLFDVYESDWAGEEDLGAIVEVSGTKKKDLLQHILIPQVQKRRNACITRGTRPHIFSPCYA